MPLAKRITPCLWFDGQAEAAANQYVGIFPNSRIIHVSRYTDAGMEVHQQKPGTVMVVAFELDGQSFTALNGGPQFKFNEAVSFQVNCRSQEEIDHYWARLGEGGDSRAQNCGWLKDRFGVSWQVIPDTMSELFAAAGPEGAKRAMTAMLAMKKIDLAALRRAAAGRS